MGCSITAESLGTWEAFIAKNPAAKPFKNKGWAHFDKMALILPDMAVHGGNGFCPSDGAMGIEPMLPQAASESSPVSSPPSPSRMSPQSDTEKDGVNLQDQDGSQICSQPFYFLLKIDELLLRSPSPPLLHC